MIKNFQNNNYTNNNSELAEGEEFLKFMRNFTSSIIDFQVRIEKKILSLDKIQTEQIEKLSTNFFSSLRNLAYKEENTEHKKIDSTSESQDTRYKVLDHMNLSIYNSKLSDQIYEIIISLNDIKLKINEDILNEENKIDIVEKLVDFSNYLKEPKIKEINEPKHPINDSLEKFGDLNNKILSFRSYLDKQIIECSNIISNISKNINFMIEKNSNVSQKNDNKNTEILNKFDEYHKYEFNLDNMNVYFEKYGLISHDKIEEGKKLGEGGFGEVLVGKLNKYTPIAIKKIQKKSKTGLLKILKEVDLMYKLKHPKLVHFYGFWKDKNDCDCLIMDICKGGDLSSYLHKQDKTEVELTMTQRFEILKDIAEGINHFHINNIVHRDIKCDNVLISDKITKNNNQFKAFLSDYGESIEMIKIQEKLKIFEESKDSNEDLIWSEYNGTIQYAPLEILEGDIRKLSLKSDIYSFGSVIYEVFTEKIPYEEQEVEGFELSLRIISQNIKPNTDNFIKDTPLEIKDLINECWKHESNLRPNIEEILKKLIEMQNKYKFTNDFSVIYNKIQKKSNLDDKINDLYVLPKGAYSETSLESFDLYKCVVEKFIQQKDKKVLLILGGSGSGKSLFSKFLQDSIINQHKSYLPFRADLNSIKKPYTNLVDELLKVYEIDEKEMNKIKDMKIIFILDGYDEISGNKNIYNMNSLNNYPNAKLIISSR